MSLKSRFLLIGLLILVVLGNRQAAHADEPPPPSGQIAFARLTPRGREVWIVNTVGGREYKVTEAHIRSPSVSWSPDGSSLLFSQADGRLVVANQWTDITRRLLRNGCCFYTPQWSPNGRMLLAKVVHDLEYKLVLMRPDGTEQRELIPPNVPSAYRFSNADDRPQWSLDSKRIAFVAGTNNQALSLCVINADGTGFIRLDTMGLNPSFPTWSPDGTRLAFTALSGGTRNLYTIDIATSKMTKLASDLGSGNKLGVAHPAWSRDGRWIVYVGETSREIRDIFVVEVETGKVTQLTYGPEYNLSPSWSPESDYIVYSSILPTDPSRQAIMLVSVDGSVTQQLTDGLPIDLWPVWGPEVQ